MTDDSTHLDKTRHVVLMTAHKPKEDVGSSGSSAAAPPPDLLPEELACPCFRFVTASESPSKDSDGNCKVNVNSLKDYVSSLSVLAPFRGSVTDNASDAMLESSKTFDAVMKLIAPALQLVYGVACWVLKLGDWFHIDNLIVTHASLAAFGKTVPGSHRQIHHQQLVQSLHDVHRRNRSASQKAMDKVLQGT